MGSAGPDWLSPNWRESLATSLVTQTAHVGATQQASLYLSRILWQIQPAASEQQLIDTVHC